MDIAPSLLTSWHSHPTERSFHDDFLNPGWQIKNSIQSLKELRNYFPSATEAVWNDVAEGMRSASMSLRITPYLLSRINPASLPTDPIARQFLIFESQRETEHPMAQLDSLHEKSLQPAPGLVHRYRDRALLLTTQLCPIYCQFCTRSYGVGPATDTVPNKTPLSESFDWDACKAYLQTHQEIEDVLISGGDPILLPLPVLKSVLHDLLEMNHILRIRIATRGLTALPMKFTVDERWLDFLTSTSELARRRGQALMIHTHFNHPNEISTITEDALRSCYQRQITLRNQTVLLRGINDQAPVLIHLIKRLASFHVPTMYVHHHDFVPGVEHLRTSVQRTVELEKLVRGHIAGFMTPTFVVDLPGGAGKRDIHSFESYDPTRGIALYRNHLETERRFAFFDPISALPPEGQNWWKSLDLSIDSIEFQ